MLFHADFGDAPEIHGTRAAVGTIDCIALLKQQLRDKLIEHREYIVRHGEDLPEIRDWRWGA